uniref:DNA polymerase III epsilon subunit n=1 Tax=Candidatus Fritschea bemisiae TaxID=206681 RepID=Q7X394_9BACT|nr:DNA polymerase III epsilon subunit [Candidatus Fritschea bemisiae]
MGLLKKEIFVCFDCESTGLDPEKDRIIEIAAIKFSFNAIIDSIEDLINPETLIPQETTRIHHITDEMVQKSPKINEVIQSYLDFIGESIVVGHGIPFDLALLEAEAKRAGVPSRLLNQRYLDTLRLARLYGESPTNSLESLRKHFNIQGINAHRAMSDVLVNIDVFKYLSQGFNTVEELFKKLEKPIALRAMPLGKHKGRSFREIPTEYLKWACHQNFDQDLLFSLRTELKKRKEGTQFFQAANPFSKL